MVRLPRTLAKRRCGHCQRTLGVSLWPWSGRPVVVTHGLCRRCYRALLAKEQTAPPDAAPARRASA